MLMQSLVYILTSQNLTLKTNTQQSTCYFILLSPRYVKSSKFDFSFIVSDI